MFGLLRRYRTYLRRTAINDRSRLFQFELQWQAALWLVPISLGGIICYWFGLTEIQRLIVLTPFAAITIFGWVLVWWESEPSGPA